MNFERKNPLTGEVASSAVAMQPNDMAAICDKAEAGFAEWSQLGPNARRATLMSAADALQAKQAEFVDAMMNEIGATQGWAMFNLMLASSMLREAASITTQISGEVIPSDKPGCLAMALREPVGVDNHQQGGDGTHSLDTGYQFEQFPELFVPIDHFHHLVLKFEYLSKPSL